jgi:hypothetical protein
MATLTACPAPELTPEAMAERLDALCTHGTNAKSIAGLVEMCSEDIYKELAAIKEQHPGALVRHSQDLTDHLSFLVDRIRDMAEDIENKAADVSESLRKMVKGGCAVSAPTRQPLSTGSRG